MGACNVAELKGAVSETARKRRRVAGGGWLGAQPAVLPVEHCWVKQEVIRVLPEGQRVLGAL